MAEIEIPLVVKRFIYKYIGSVQQLDVFLIVASAREGIGAAEVAQKLGVTLSAAEIRLLSLCAKGLIKADEKSSRLYAYVPAGEATTKTLEELRIAQRDHRAALTELIGTKMETQIKGFSDAFIIKPPPKNE